MAAPSMTLKVTRDDAQRMLKASQALKRSIRLLQKQCTDTAESKENDSDPPVPQRVVSTSDTESVVSGTGEESTIWSSRPLHALVLKAAERCDDEHIRFFVRELKKLMFETNEIQTSLLIFLDADKNPKSLSAFQSLSEKENEEDAEKPALELELNRKGVVSLFRCFLSSICLCIKENSQDHDVKQSPAGNCSTPRKFKEEPVPSSPPGSMHLSSPPLETGEAMRPMILEKSPTVSSRTYHEAPQRHLSGNTMSEIVEIATFAADQLYANTKGKGSEGATISFRDFEDWYKGGGYSVVPWMELLHLSKWNEVELGTVSAENSPSKDDRKVKAESVAGDVQGEEESPVPPSAKKLRHSALNPKTDMPNFFMERDPSPHPAPTAKALVTFDFTGSIVQNDGTGGSSKSSLCINITEDNLVTLSNLVSRTELSSRLPADLTKVLMAHSRKVSVNGRTIDAMHKDDFGKCIREIVPAHAARSFSRLEMESFSIYFTNFFACYENSHEGLGESMVDVKEFAIGFSLLCAGNKSAKLVNGFELLDEHHRGYLTEEELTNYIRSYLAMLVGISLLAETAEKHDSLTDVRKKDMLCAVAHGAKWTLGHFLSEYKADAEDSNEGKFTFGAFARWYTNGGFKYAPWLELLDLRKLLSLLSDNPHGDTSLRKEAPPSAFRSSSKFHSPRRRKAPGGFSSAPSSEVLFTFPLANDRSLVVLREDATYVRSVVEKLGLLSLSPDDIWSGLFSRAKQRPPPPPHPWNRSRHRKPGKGKSMDIDQHSFVECMEDLMSSRGRKYQPMAAKETLQNFFQSFDLDQIDRVALNQLMGGLSLLCGGKKSTKLAFSFGLFDSRKDKVAAKHPSLNVDDLFVFLRSFLIVMFSCCRQSLDLSADRVSRYIADTSHMVAEDVMRFQWHTRSKDRIDFDEFGEWYNEGGFETAPWLELLDLNKWVLLNNLIPVEHHRQPNSATAGMAAASRNSGVGDYCPSPPPEDAVDASFFADDDMAIMPLDSMDEMDLMLMQQPSHDKENDGFILGKDAVTFSMTPSPKDGRETSCNALKFHLVSSEDHGGYMVSVSQTRVRHLRHVLVETGLFSIDAEVACRKILGKASKDLRLNKKDFDSAMTDVVGGRERNRMSLESRQVFTDLLTFIFDSFDREKTGLVSAIELACGLTVLCDGKKSDKLEYAFEVLDVKRQGRLSRRDVGVYLRSFLTALLCVTTSSHLRSNPSEDTVFYMNGKQCDRDATAIIRAADAGSSWASVQAFRGCYSGRTELDHLNFDDFADWYTKKGYSCIPWLELLDLRKWVITE
jgi:Ca2+-binding EF-hand superfamily protein